MIPRPLRMQRAVPLLQAVTGALLLARPEALVALVSGDGARPASWIVRVLGARMTGQGCVIAARPHRTLLIAGVAADLAHALSMVWIAREAPRYQRPATASALTAAAFAGASAATAGSRR